MDATIVFLFILNNLVWMAFFGYFVYNLLPDKHKKDWKTPRVRIKNPLAKPVDPMPYEEVTDINAGRIMEQFIKDPRKTAGGQA